ncbi:MAG: hypothetical protein IIZ73_09570 [Ruminococcus sp.]|nr:hypothetical protein [Ruminococcus sp.]
MEESKSERAADSVWVFLVIFAFLLMLAGIGLAILAVGVAVSDKDFPVAALFAAGAAVCFGLNRLIVKLDDKRDAEKKKQAEEKRAAQIRDITYNDDVLGTVSFTYDPEEMIITAEKEQLPAFANGEGICVRAYDDLIGYTGSPEKAALKLIEAVKRVYNDKDELMSGLCGAYLSRCESEGITETDGAKVDEELIRKTMRYEKLWVGCDDGRRCNAELKAVPDPGILFDTAARAEFFTDEAGYKYGTRANW